MKKLLIILCLSTFVGCAWLGQQVDYQKACMADPVCLEDSKKDSQLVKALFDMAFPGAGAVGGAGALALALWFRGRKKKEQK